MRTVGLLVVVLLALAACRAPGGEDPWSTEGWVNNQMDYETDFWEPAPQAPTRTTTRAAPRAPAAQPVPQAPVMQPAPRVPAPQPAAPAAPRGSYGVPPPPPPPYELPR